LIEAVLRQALPLDQMARKLTCLGQPRLVGGTILLFPGEGVREVLESEIYSPAYSEDNGPVTIANYPGYGHA
jgi:hypothetical protein